MIEPTNSYIDSTTESHEQSTSSTDKQHTSVVINNSTSSTSSEELNNQFSLSTSGKYHIQCRLFTKENKPFGDILWLLCDVM